MSKNHKDHYQHMTRLEKLAARRRNKTTMRLPQLNKANRLARRHANTVRHNIPVPVQALLVA